MPDCDDYTTETVEVNTCDLIGVALDWAVAKCKGYKIQYSANVTGIFVNAGDGYEYFTPSTNWAQGGPIIEREIAKLFKNMGKTYTAQIRYEEDHPLVQHKVLAGWLNCAGPTPLIAAMRCYVASKLGDTVEIPKDLFVGAV